MIFSFSLENLDENEKLAQTTAANHKIYLIIKWPSKIVFVFKRSREEKKIVAKLCLATNVGKEFHDKHESFKKMCFVGKNPSTYHTRTKLLQSLFRCRSIREVAASNFTSFPSTSLFFLVISFEIHSSTFYTSFFITLIKCFFCRIF